MRPTGGGVGAAGVASVMAVTGGGDARTGVGDGHPADDPVAARKADHLALAASTASQSDVDPGWDDVRLVPRALPELSPADVDTSVDLFGHRLSAPLVLVPMTGGHPDAGPLNAVLGAAAERLGLAVGVGSQRAALRRPDLAETFAAVRHDAPSALVMANIGAGQLVAQGDVPPLGPADLEAIVAMVRADVLTIHLNAAQELVQPEGDVVTGPFLPALAAAVAASPVPVVVKETGSGMSRADAVALAEVGVAGLDVGGAGGTSFVRIEAARAEAALDGRALRRGRLLAGWGLPTAASVLEVRGAGLPVVATGGVRDGHDVARALALGAAAAGLGRRAILAAQVGLDALVTDLEGIVDELRTVMVLSGAATPAALRATPPVLVGPTLEWARQRALL